MITIGKCTRESDNALLVIRENSDGDYKGLVYRCGKMKGRADMSAVFFEKDKDNTVYRVQEYFGFLKS